MRRTLVLLATAAALAAPLAPAQAQNAVATETFIKATPTDVLSYNLIGLKVTNPANESVGEIKDLILSQGQLAGYILSVGGFLGIGEHYVIVRPAAVKVAYSEADKKWSAVMSTTKEALKAAPEFKYDGRWKR
ncbi:photosystem reaction center subunit H [Azorhizobium oxalatiphilum]|uniref:Photosystem reaction center subunit H n=1 Tax=Azorhizobium oxalatiphilum TaxID=980631 RepID=A0A917FJL6_9HYPH|nr:PRC-barrel domain-containing protein [Azorhizobium oxalatiphilum]GGF86484.1 photosystem reaction center subunit H [Azorhizobium oxalatiphilum]